jgi:hypothetical protein
MKIMISILACLLLTIAALAAGTTKQTSKLADQPLDLRKEVAAYYAQLVESDEDVQKQIARLTAHSREKAGGLFKLSEEPQAFEWFPRSESRTEKGDAVHGHFLVVQTAGRWRTKDSDDDMALIADFDVDYDENTPQGVKLTITFLGFRKIALSPVSSGK